MREMHEQEACLPQTDEYHTLAPAAKGLIGFALLWRLSLSYLAVFLIFKPLSVGLKALLQTTGSSIGLRAVAVQEASQLGDTLLLFLLALLASALSLLWFLHSTFGPYRLRLVRNYPPLRERRG